MIVRPQQHWLRLIFVWHGSVLAKISSRLLLNFLLSIVVIVLLPWYTMLGIKFTLAPLVKIHSPATAGNLTAPPAKAAPATRQVKKSTATDDRQLSHWLLSRPTGNNEAKLAAWKAACPLRE